MPSVGPILFNKINKKLTNQEVMKNNDMKKQTSIIIASCIFIMLNLSCSPHENSKLAQKKNITPAVQQQIIDTMTLKQATSVNNLIFITEQLPPYTFVNDDSEKVGIYMDIVVDLLEEVGSTIRRDDIQFYPWARAYNTLKVDKRAVVFTTSRTKEREPLFKWVGPLSSYVNQIVVLRSRDIHINSNSDLHKYRLGAVRNTFDEISLLERGVNIGSLTSVNNPKQLITMLLKGRIDGFAYSKDVASYLIKQEGIELEVIDFILELKHTKLYLALNIDIPDEIVKTLQDGLDEMKNRPQYQHYFDRYLK